jgi:hypothetical protein
MVMKSSVAMAWMTACCMGVLWAATPPPASAGVVLTTELVDAKAEAQQQSVPPRPGRMLLDAERVRMEMAPSAASETPRVLIYRADRDLVWTVDEKRRTYSEMDRAVMQDMQAQMRANLGKMPPAQRTKMQAMLAAGEKKERDRPTITPTEREDKVGGLACREFEVSRAGKKESEVCVAEWRVAGVTKADLEVVRKLGAFQEDAFGGGQARSGGEDVLTIFDELDGIPVRVRSFRADQPRSEFRVVKIERKPLEPKLFEVPDGYTKRTLPGTRRAPAPAAARPDGAKPDAAKAPLN